MKALLERRMTPRFVWTATIAGLGIMLAFFVAIGQDYYRGTLALAGQQATNVVALVEQAVSREIELYDLSLQAVLDGLRDPAVMAQPPRMRRITLFDRSATAQGLGALVALDQNGTIVADSLSDTPRAGNFADREYFQVQKSGERRGLYISKPFRARLQGEIWSLSISRRIDRADGSFGGIVSGTVKLDYLRQRFNKVNLGPHGTITLLRDDGVMIVQNNRDDSRIGADWSGAEIFRYLASAPAGLFWSGPSMDGTPRLYAYRRVADLPLVVSVGLATAEVMKPFWQKIAALAAVFALMTLSILVLVVMFTRELRRRASGEEAQAALARQDALTGLANRLGLEEALAAHWRHGRRTGSTMALLMIDLDLFKQLNDNLGHVEGDHVLAEVARLVSDGLHRPFDVAARYGGEEIAVLLPDTPLDGAIAIGRLIRHAVEARGLRHPTSPYGVVTVSIGAAAVTPDEADASVLVMLADQALYAAKRNGRNRVEAADDAAQPDAEARLARA